MISKVVLILAVLVVASASLIREVPGTPAVQRRVKVARNFWQATCAAHQVSTCQSCTSIAACINGKPDPVAVPCSALDSSRPYCFTGADGFASCRATPDESFGCSVPVVPFRCTANGYFPDPSDCKKYHICMAGTALTYECGLQDFLYNPHTNMCRYSTAFAAMCAANSVSCQNTQSLLIPFAVPNNNYYVYCKPNAEMKFDDPEPVVLQCAEGLRYVAGVCQFVCTEEGLFAVPGSMSSYVNCVMGANNELLKFTIDCPAGTIFNGRRCEIVITTTLPPGV